MVFKQTFVVLMAAWLVAGQRPSFAGSKPIGYPDIPTTGDPLGNRFGEGDNERLPIEAKGDRGLIDRLSKLPLDQQPFWFINWKAVEANNKNPQTYPQRENSFIFPQNNSPSTGQNFQMNTAPNSNGLTSKFGSNEESGIAFNDYYYGQNQQGRRRYSRFYGY